MRNLIPAILGLCCFLDHVVLASTEESQVKCAAKLQIPLETLAVQGHVGQGNWVLLPNSLMGGPGGAPKLLYNPRTKETFRMPDEPSKPFHPRSVADSLKPWKYLGKQTDSPTALAVFRLGEKNPEPYVLLSLPSQTGAEPELRIAKAADVPGVNYQFLGLGIPPGMKKVDEFMQRKDALREELGWPPAIPTLDAVSSDTIASTLQSEIGWRLSNLTLDLMSIGLRQPSPIGLQLRAKQDQLSDLEFKRFGLEKGSRQEVALSKQVSVLQADINKLNRQDSENRMINPLQQAEMRKWLSTHLKCEQQAVDDCFRDMLSACQDANLDRMNKSMLRDFANSIATPPPSVGPTSTGAH